MSETPIKDRIREFAASIRMSDRVFQNMSGLGDGFMSRPSEPISSAIGQILSAFPQLSPDWLLNGEGPMTRPLREHPSVIDVTPAQIVAEPTPAYHGVKSKDITLPVRVYEELLNQLKKKDQQLEDSAAQIRTLFEMINSHNV